MNEQAGLERMWNEKANRFQHRERRGAELAEKNERVGWFAFLCALCISALSALKAFALAFLEEPSPCPR